MSVKNMTFYKLLVFSFTNISFTKSHFFSHNLYPVKPPAVHFFFGGRSILEPVLMVHIHYMYQCRIPSVLSRCYFTRFQHLVEKRIWTECVIRLTESGSVVSHMQQKTKPIGSANNCLRICLPAARTFLHNLLARNPT